MDIGEMVTSLESVKISNKCPFDHEEDTHDRKNVLPPPKTKNDAVLLSENLDAESKHLPNIEIMLESGKTATARFSAHHLIPGNESWKKSKLHRWVDKRKRHIKGDIGYDVNGHRNGIDLPGHVEVANWGGRSAKYQKEYAFASMEADQKARQFHDRHPAYSDFVVKVLDKIAARLDARLNGSAGCGKSNCPGNKKDPPFDPPYHLLDRINAVAARFESKLYGSPRFWKKPLMTSRFALMYKDRQLTEDEAREALNVNNFNP